MSKLEKIVRDFLLTIGAITLLSIAGEAKPPSPGIPCPSLDCQMYDTNNNQFISPDEMHQIGANKLRSLFTAVLDQKKITLEEAYQVLEQLPSYQISDVILGDLEYGSYWATRLANKDMDGFVDMLVDNYRSAKYPLFVPIDIYYLLREVEPGLQSEILSSMKTKDFLLYAMVMDMLDPTQRHIPDFYYRLDHS